MSTASSSDPQAHTTKDGKKKLTRTKTPKTKGGCVPCKARHVKCDETKPSCLRCLRFWGICEGFSPPKPYSSFKATKSTVSEHKRIQPLLPRLHQSRQALLDQTPPFHSPFRSGSEHRYFQTFRTTTVAGLLGLFTTSLWSTLILQACHDEEFVLDAVVAIGALSSCGRELIQDASPTQLANVFTGTPNYRFALQHYGRAVQKMRKSISRGEKHLRKALLGCLLVICFENLQGNCMQALTHAVSGHQLLQNWLAANPQTDPRKEGLTSPNPVVIEDDLVLAFGRLDLQVMAYVDPRPASSHPVLMHEGEVSILHMLSRFKDAEEARLYHERIARRTSHFLASLAAQSPEVPILDIDLGIGQPAARFHAESEIYSSLPLSSPKTDVYKRYGEDIRRWFATFMPLYDRFGSEDGREGTALGC